ncbi:MAG: hypothetical protein CFH32_00404 [Alphaproteobacteria bacterium MarineAlpha9_Bin2]|nr:MAG: hypothetical protein CFH32_00404 [Alphaproteobacteria bacterium MarineAlpha9_Bin2]
MSEDLFLIVSVVILSVVLYFPVNKLIWVLSVRRLEKKSKKKLTEIERKLQLKRARFISAILVLTFSYLFNLQIL